MEDFIVHAHILVPALAALGAAAGFLAGLLGIGGGIILVPGLYFLFKTLSYDPAILMHMAVGTSLAIIIPTGISSALAHYRRDAVRFDLVASIGPGIVLGVIAGAAIADRVDGHALTVIFASALGVFAIIMQIKPREDAQKYGTITQPRASMGGFVVGILSSLMGIGGATLNVPFMTMHGVGIRNAVATSSALGPWIALPGTIGFTVIGWGVSGLPPLSLGYINLPALCMIAPASMLIAPLGVRAAHAAPVKTLRLIFSIFLVIVAARMIFEAWHG